MKYELVYFNEFGYYQTEESDKYAVYKVTDDMSKMCCFYQKNGDNIEKFIHSNWFKYRALSDGFQRDISEDDVFLFCI